MFEYNYNPRTHELFVTLPQNMKFDYNFHCDVAGLLYHALGNDENNEKINNIAGRYTSSGIMLRLPYKDTGGIIQLRDIFQE